MSTSPSEPLIFVNGEFFPEKEARISPLDRGFMYGDAVFETIRVREGKQFLWTRHIDRLALGVIFLRMPTTILSEIPRFADEIIRRNLLQNGFLRIHISRGCGSRGYSPKGAVSPSVVMTTHVGLPAVPERLRLMTSKFRVMADEPWTQLKTANRLTNVLARAEAEDAGLDEALILNHRWTVAGASAANVFCVRNGALVTPTRAAGGIAGTTRGFIMDSARKLGIEVREEEMTLEYFHQSEASFLTSAGLLVAAVESLDSKPKNWSHPMIEQMRKLCEEATE